MKILVKLKEEKDSAWIFEAQVDGTDYQVTVSKEYWEELTKKKITPEDLVRKSFEFLLAREPKESILGEFELPIIQSYFPEYESEIQKLS